MTKAILSLSSVLITLGCSSDHPDSSPARVSAVVNEAPAGIIYSIESAAITRASDGYGSPVLNLGNGSSTGDKIVLQIVDLEGAEITLEN